MKTPSANVSLFGGNGDLDAEVIGVVADSRERGPASDPTLTVYLPYGRNALVSEFVLHTRGNPLAVVPTVRAIVAGLDPNLPLADVRSFEEVVRRSLSPQRFNVVLLTVFGGLALLLATTGIYGVLAYSMSRRTAEIGLRVALGASRTDVLGSFSAKECGRLLSACCWAHSAHGGCRAIWRRYCSASSPLMS